MLAKLQKRTCFTAASSWTSGSKTAISFIPFYTNYGYTGASINKDLFEPSFFHNTVVTSENIHFDICMT